jgi:hypothetical protein
LRCDDRWIEKGVSVEVDEREIRKWIGGTHLCLILTNQSARSPILAFSISPSTFLASSQIRCLLRWTFELDRTSPQIAAPDSYCLLLQSLNFGDRHPTFSTLSRFKVSIPNRMSIPKWHEESATPSIQSPGNMSIHFSPPGSDSRTVTSNIEALVSFEMEWESCSEWWMNFKFHGNFWGSISEEIFWSRFCRFERLDQERLWIDPSFMLIRLMWVTLSSFAEIENHWKEMTFS